MAVAGIDEEIFVDGSIPDFQKPIGVKETTNDWHDWRPDLVNEYKI